MFFNDFVNACKLVRPHTVNSRGRCCSLIRVGDDRTGRLSLVSVIHTNPTEISLLPSAFVSHLRVRSSLR